MSYGPLAKRWGWGGGVLPFYRFTGKMAKHVCSCHGTQCFQSEQGGQWRGSGRKERGREGEVKALESGGHMSPLLLSARISQAFRAKHRHRG